MNLTKQKINIMLYINGTFNTKFQIIIADKHLPVPTVVDKEITELINGIVVIITLLSYIRSNIFIKSHRSSFSCWPAMLIFRD